MSSTLQITPSVVKSFIPTKNFSYHQLASITSLDFDDSGQFLISAGVDKSIQLYDIHKGVHLKDIKSQKYGAHLAKFTHLNKNCLYASTPAAIESGEIDHTVRLLSLDTNQYVRYFKGHKESVTSLEVDPVHDIFISSSMDLTVKLWDLRSSSPVGGLDVGEPSIVAFDPMGVVFLVAKPSTCTLQFYDMHNYDRKPFLTLYLRDFINPAGGWNKVEFSNNGRFVLILTDYDEHYIVDAFLGKLLKVLKIPGNNMKFNYPYNGSLTFTPCGKFVLVGSSEHEILVFDLSSTKTSEGGSINIDDKPNALSPLKTIVSDQGIPKLLAFNPKLLTFASADTTVCLWQPLI